MKQSLGKVKPIKGVDYWTREEIQGMIDEIIRQIGGVTTKPEDIQKAVELYLKGNPLTAEDVGARPDNWMPSAEEVGALPIGTKIPVVDNTNSKTGQAADAKVTGDAIKDLRTAFGLVGDGL